MKEFIFDRLVNRENICDLEKEKKLLQKLIAQKQNIVLYAQRNYGKTSLVKNVIIDDFRKDHKKSFIFFVDLMGVKDLDSIIFRLKQALEHSIKESFPIKSFIASIGELITNLKTTISVDAASGIPTVSIEPINPSKKKVTIEDIFHSIEKIGKKIPTLIVLDEFQDVSLVHEAESLFRNAFQQLRSLPIIILGSKKHLLKNIFALPKSPLANFGKDVTIQSIDYEKYHEYISERFTLKKLKISKEDSRYLQDLMQRQPEAINLLCYEIYQNHNHKKIDRNIISEAIQQILDQRNKRFEVMLLSFSSTEEKVVTAIAKEQRVSQPQSKEFTSKVNLTAKTVKTNINKLMNLGIIDTDNNQYYVCDPLLNLYLKYFR
ncbi:MAG: ATP-binding protein [Proteobacteria bacterium]|nr:ATP-binding protein [Pseudomonadota bacterium]